MNVKPFSIFVSAVFLSLMTPVAFSASEDDSKMDHSRMDHSGHSMHGPAVGYSQSTSKGELNKLTAMPPSGRAREAGSDGRFVMEVTSVTTALDAKCAQATRGIVMLDNATWKRCGGKPKGASMGVDKPAGGEHQHMQH